MQQSIRLFLPVLIVVSAGCTGTHHAAKYAWLRKQGPVNTCERPPAPRPETVMASLPPAGLQIDEDRDLLAAPFSADASADHFLGSPLTGRAGMELTISSKDPAVEVLVPAPAQDSAYYPPEPQRWNIKGVAALPIALTTVILGIASQSVYLLLIGGAIAFALGLIGSRQCRDRGDRGKGFAIAGMALGAAALFFGLMVLIWAA